MYETGRPTFELSSIGLFVIGRKDEAPLYGLRSYLTVDVGNLRGGDDCAKQAIEGESYSFLEPLLFIVTITVKAGSLVISGSMSGVWTKYVANVELLRYAFARVFVLGSNEWCFFRAFGLDSLHFTGLQLEAKFTGIAVSSLESSKTPAILFFCARLRVQFADGIICRWWDHVARDGLLCR